MKTKSYVLVITLSIVSIVTLTFGCLNFIKYSTFHNNGVRTNACLNIVKFGGFGYYEYWVSYTARGENYLTFDSYDEVLGKQGDSIQIFYLENSPKKIAFTEEVQFSFRRIIAPLICGLVLLINTILIIKYPRFFIKLLERS